MEVVTIVVQNHLMCTLLVFLFASHPQSITKGSCKKKILTTRLNMSSIYIFNNKLFMFKQVILRSVGDTLCRCPCFICSILKEVGRELHLLQIQKDRDLASKPKPIPPPLPPSPSELRRLDPSPLIHFKNQHTPTSYMLSFDCPSFHFCFEFPF